MSTILMILAAVALVIVTGLDSKAPMRRASYNCTADESSGSVAMGIAGGVFFAALLAIGMGLIVW